MIILYNCTTRPRKEDSVKSDFTEETQRALTETLTDAGFSSPSDAALELSLTIALARVSRYERECQQFRHKYGEPFEALRSRTDLAIGTEEFPLEDDLADWEFAERSLALWQKRVDLLRHAIA